MTDVLTQAEFIINQAQRREDRLIFSSMAAGLVIGFGLVALGYFIIKGDL